MTRKHTSVLIVILMLSALAGVPASPAYADGVVTNCSNDADFSSQLSGGGTVTFNCGTATIVLSSTKTITVNTAIDGGGTITLSGDDARRLFVVNPGARLELHNIVIEKGFSNSGDGGAIRNLDTLVIANSQFLSNTVTSDWNGGAIYSNSHLAISDSTFSYNQGGSAGAIYSQSSVSQLNIFHSTFDHNRATHASTLGFGGALLLTDSANATVTSSTFSQNQARTGGAVDVRSGSRLAIDDSTIRNNLAGSGGDAGGGGIDNDASTVRLTNVTLSGNSAGEGGGINTFAGTLTLDKVTLSNNSASYGAGIYLFLGTHTLTNVTFSGNSAHNAGGIYNSRATLTLINVTLAGNSSDTGLTGGIVNGGGGPDPQLNLKNVILAAGTTGDNCEFTLFPPDSSEFNLSNDNSCSFGASRDGVNLLLGPLADNGGSTRTHLLRTGSPAIDNGTNTGCPATDQRGQARPVNSTCDVGAVEYVPGELSPWLYLPLVLR